MGQPTPGSWASVAVTIKEVLETVRSRELPPVGADEETLSGRTQLHDVLQELDPNLNGQAIGIYLNGQKGRIVDGLRLLNAGKQSGSTKWRVSAGEHDPAHALGEDRALVVAGGDEGASDV